MAKQSKTRESSEFVLLHTADNKPQYAYRASSLVAILEHANANYSRMRYLETLFVLYPNGDLVELVARTHWEPYVPTPNAK